MLGLRVWGNACPILARLNPARDSGMGWVCRVPCEGKGCGHGWCVPWDSDHVSGRSVDIVGGDGGSHGSLDWLSGIGGYHSERWRGFNSL